MDPKSDTLESLFEGDGVSCSPYTDKGLPTISRVVLGGVVGGLLTMIDGISAGKLDQFSWIRQEGGRTLFVNAAQMILEPSSIDDHLEERLHPIQVDQICYEFVGLRSDNEVPEPRKT